ncbi:hypothetical protein HDV00_007951, partial [Rhizophlyctis rosea]
MSSVSFGSLGRRSDHGDGSGTGTGSSGGGGAAGAKGAGWTGSSGNLAGGGGGANSDADLKGLGVLSGTVPAEALKYADYFVIQNDTTFELLIDRLNKGLDATLELQDLLAARAEAESQYAKSIGEALKRRAVKTETGPLRITIDRLSLLTNVYAGSHLQLGVRIGEEISGPLSVLIAELKRLRRHVQGEWERGKSEGETVRGAMQKVGL